MFVSPHVELLSFNVCVVFARLLRLPSLLAAALIVARRRSFSDGFQTLWSSAWSPYKKATLSSGCFVLGLIYCATLDILLCALCDIGNSGERRTHTRLVCPSFSSSQGLWPCYSHTSTLAWICQYASAYLLKILRFSMYFLAGSSHSSGMIGGNGDMLKIHLE